MEAPTAPKLKAQKRFCKNAAPTKAQEYPTVPPAQPASPSAAQPTPGLSSPPKLLAPGALATPQRARPSSAKYGVSAAVPPATQAAVAERAEAIQACFTASGREQVGFYPKGGQWMASVTEQSGVFSRVRELSVVCQGHRDIQAALQDLQGKSAHYTQQRIHVLPKTGEKAALVFIGALGLKGGGSDAKRRSQRARASRCSEEARVAAAISEPEEVSPVSAVGANPVNSSLFFSFSTGQAAEVLARLQVNAPLGSIERQQAPPTEHVGVSAPRPSQPFSSGSASQPGLFGSTEHHRPNMPLEARTVPFWAIQQPETSSGSASQPGLFGSTEHHRPNMPLEARTAPFWAIQQPETSSGSASQPGLFGSTEHHRPNMPLEARIASFWASQQPETPVGSSLDRLTPQSMSEEQLELSSGEGRATGNRNPSKPKRKRYRDDHQKLSNSLAQKRYRERKKRAFDNMKALVDALMVENERLKQEFKKYGQQAQAPSGLGHNVADIPTEATPSPLPLLQSSADIPTEATPSPLPLLQSSADIPTEGQYHEQQVRAPGHNVAEASSLVSTSVTPLPSSTLDAQIEYWEHMWKINICALKELSSPPQASIFLGMYNSEVPQEVPLQLLFVNRELTRLRQQQLANEEQIRYGSLQELFPNHFPNRSQ